MTSVFASLEICSMVARVICHSFPGWSGALAEQLDRQLAAGSLHQFIEGGKGDPLVGVLRLLDEPHEPLRTRSLVPARGDLLAVVLRLGETGPGPRRHLRRVGGRFELGDPRL